MQDSDAHMKRSSDPHFRGTNQSRMRGSNERLVLSLLRSEGPMPKAEIARITGLSAQTVSVIMRALEADGLLIRGKPIRGKVGQPSIPMKLSPEGAFFFGLKIGRRSIDVVLTDFLVQQRDRRIHVHSHPDPENTLAFAKASVEEMIAAMDPGDRDRIGGLGIAMPYFMWNWADIIGVPNSEMAGWRTIDIVAELQEHFGFPVYVENDASTACLAELTLGQHNADADFLYFYVGFFIGGGICLNGALYTGPDGNAAALGPLPVPKPDGQMGELIDVASLSQLERAFRDRGNDTGDMWTSTDLWPHDPVAVDQWVAEAAKSMAHAINVACSVINFETVLIDGWMNAELRSTLSARIRDELASLKFVGLNRPDVMEGSVGPDARTFGAACLPLSRRYLLEDGAVK